MQWSIRESPADGLRHIARVSVPTLIVENGADDGVPPSHPRAMFGACSARDKEFGLIDGANHYYDGQPVHLRRAVQRVLEWLNTRGLTRVAMPTAAVPPADPAAMPTDLAHRLAELRSSFGGRGKMQLRGINHLALVSGDMHRTCEFYAGVLGRCHHGRQHACTGGVRYLSWVQYSTAATPRMQRTT